MRFPRLPLGSLAFALGLLGAGCGDSTDPRPAAWSYISAAITQPDCATVSCHSRAAAVAGLDFSSEARGYTSLTGLWIWIVDPNGDLGNGCLTADGTVVCPREHRSLVVPFDPAQSRLIHMLRAQGAPRMPPDRPLPEADIRLVENWILSGALVRPGVAPDTLIQVDGGFGGADAGGSPDGAAADATGTDGQTIDGDGAAE